MWFREYGIDGVKKRDGIIDVIVKEGFGIYPSALNTIVHESCVISQIRPNGPDFKNQFSDQFLAFSYI